MDYDPEFSKKSTAELNSCLTKYSEEHEFYSRALSERPKEKNWQKTRSHLNFPRLSFGAGLRQSLLFLEHYL
jgi:hypothetical protein